MKISFFCGVFLLGLQVCAESYSLTSKSNGFNPLAIQGAWQVTAPALAGREHRLTITLGTPDGRSVAQKSLVFLSSTDQVSLYFFQYIVPPEKETRLDFYLSYTSRQEPHPGSVITMTRYIAEKFVIPSEFGNFFVLRYRDRGTLQAGKELPVIQTLFKASPRPADWNDLAHGRRQSATRPALTVSLKLSPAPENGSTLER